MARAQDRVNSALSKHGYTQLRKVGEGAFGAAILCQDASDKGNDTKAIVKMIDISRATRQERDDALKESKVLSALRHPYIVRYRENFLEDGWLCIAMDYCEGGDLSDRIKRMRSQRKAFSEEQVLRWFTQAILALKHIHDMKILHRDLKSGNFFLSKSGNLKMGDFGIAKVLECTAACAQTQIGTPYYLSPEICSGKPYSWGSDMWSMGCILFELCARKVPFDAPDLKSLIRKITSGTPPDIPDDYSYGLKHLCKEMLSRNPDDRPHAQDVLKRPVVQEVVRRMLEEVKSDEAENANGAGAPARSGYASKQQATPSCESREQGCQGGPGSYQKNEQVEFYSQTHQEWLPAIITDVDSDGRIMLNVKPNVWLGLEVQTAKVRQRTEAGNRQQVEGASSPDRPRALGGRPPPNGGAPPRAVSSPSRPVSSPNRRSEDRRPDSQRRSPTGHESALVKQPSQDRLLRRNESRDVLSPPSVGGNQEARRSSTPKRSSTPMSGREPSPRRELRGLPAAGAGIAAGVPNRRSGTPDRAAGGRRSVAVGQPSRR